MMLQITLNESTLGNDQDYSALSTSEICLLLEEKQPVPVPRLESC